MLKLNLRKARKLEAKIQKYLEDQYPMDSFCSESKHPMDSFNFLVSEPSKKVLSTLNTERKKFLSVLDEAIDLNKIRFTIRDKIGSTNAKKINSLMTKIGEHHQEIKLLDHFKDYGTRGDDGIIALDLKSKNLWLTSKNGDHQKWTNTSYYVLTKEDKNSYELKISQIQKEIETLQDDLIELNNSSFIELDSKMVSNLKKVHIL